MVYSHVHYLLPSYDDVSQLVNIVDIPTHLLQDQPVTSLLYFLSRLGIEMSVSMVWLPPIDHE